MGSFDKTEDRGWLKDFVAKKFDERDYLIFTDVAHLQNSSYTKMGSFDKTEDRESFRSKGQAKEDKAQFDKEYFSTMANSNFTLCPGGDHPWSMRFYEAIA